MIIDYAHRAKVLTTPNKDGLIPAIEVCKASYSAYFVNHPKTWTVEYDGVEHLTVSSKKNYYSFSIFLFNGDVSLYCDEELEQIYGIIAIARKYDELGIDFTKTSWI